MSQYAMGGLGKIYQMFQSFEKSEAETEGVNIFVDPEARRTPLDQSPALLFVRKSVREFKQDKISLDEFLARIERLEAKAADQLASFQATVKASLPRADFGSKDLAGALEQALQGILEGCNTLLGYETSFEPQNLVDGLAQIEEGFLDLDQAEEVADERALETTEPC